MAQQTSKDIITRHLAGAIAAEIAFEAHLNQLSTASVEATSQSLFQQHALQTNSQHKRLAARFEALGGTTDLEKIIQDHLSDHAPKPLHVQNEEERTTKSLVNAFTIESNEIAMYEVLANLAQAANDNETASLVRTIQAEEKATADKLLSMMPGAAQQAFTNMVATGPKTATAKT